MLESTIRPALPRTPLTYVLACMVASVAMGMALPSTATATAAPPESRDLCVGLACNAPASGAYVPEALESVPAVADLDELRAQKTSGFYEMPALVYRTEKQPQTVVYLVKAGEIDKIPASVRNLSVVKDTIRTEGANADRTTFVVVDHGIRMVFPADDRAAASRSNGRLRPPRARAASPSFCYDRYTCVFEGENFFGSRLELSGPIYYGTGWHNIGTNFGASQVNNRGGDSLLADHGMGTGTRYCAQQWSFDSRFSDNPIGNGNASSWALLGSRPDRC